MSGTGWEQPEATVEVGVLSAEGGEDLVDGPVQVFPDAAGNIAPTAVSFGSTPADGSYAAVVLVDGIVRGQSTAFTLVGCVPAAPTVTVEQFSCESVTVSGAGWEQTEATVEVGVLPAKGGADFVAGPVQVFPDPDGNIAITVLSFSRPPADGSYSAVVVVDGIVRGRSAAFTLTGCSPPPPTAPTPTTPPTTRAVAAPRLPATGSSTTMPLLAVGLVLVAFGVALVRVTRPG